MTVTRTSTVAERYKLELHAMPPFATIGTDVRFLPVLRPPSVVPDAWRLHIDSRPVQCASRFDAPLLANWPERGVVKVVAECTVNGNPVRVEHAVTIVKEIREELWNWLRESKMGRSADMIAEWERSLQTRFGPNLEEVLTHQQACEKIIHAEISTPDNLSKWVRSRPLKQLPEDQRDDVLTDCIAKALRGGWRMPAPEAFGPWFHKIRKNRVFDVLRMHKNRPTVQEDPDRPLSEILADESLAERPGAMGLDAVCAAAVAASAKKLPGRAVINSAVHELLEVAGLPDSAESAAVQFVVTLRGKPIKLLDRFVMAWAQLQHAALFGTAHPLHESAQRLGLCMDLLVRFQALRDRGNSDLAETYSSLIRELEPNRLSNLGLPELFAECLTIVQRTFAGHRGRWNIALSGGFFTPFAIEYPALQVFAPAWRVMELLGNDVEVTPIRQRLEGLFPTSHIDGDVRTELLTHGKTLCVGLVSMDRQSRSVPPLALLILWLHLATERKHQNRWFAEIYAVDQQWWQAQWHEIGQEEADRKVLKLLTTITPCGVTFDSEWFVDPKTPPDHPGQSVAKEIAE